MDARKILIERINAAITEAYRGIANTEEVMVLLNEYPLKNAGWADRLHSDNRELVAAMQTLRDMAAARSTSGTDQTRLRRERGLTIPWPDLSHRGERYGKGCHDEAHAAEPAAEKATTP